MSNFLINIDLFKNGGAICIGVISRTSKIYSGSALRLMGSRCILARSSTTGWNVAIHMCLCLFGVTVDGFSTIYSHSDFADLLCTNPSGSTHPRWMRFAILWRSDLVSPGLRGLPSNRNCHWNMAMLQWDSQGNWAAMLNYQRNPQDQTNGGMKITRSWWFGYGSIPIHTIFRGMNIHLPSFTSYFDVNYRGIGFWPTPILGWPRSDHSKPPPSCGKFPGSGPHWRRHQGATYLCQKMGNDHLKSYK